MGDGAWMYAVLVDFEEAYGKMDDGTAEALRRMDPPPAAFIVDEAKGLVAFLYWTPQEREMAFRQVKGIYGSASYGVRPAYVDGRHLRERGQGMGKHGKKIEAARQCGMEAASRERAAELLAVTYLWGDEPCARSERMREDIRAAWERSGIEGGGAPDMEIIRRFGRKWREAASGEAGWLKPSRRITACPSRGRDRRGKAARGHDMRLHQGKHGEAGRGEPEPPAPGKGADGDGQGRDSDDADAEVQAVRQDPVQQAGA